MLNVLYNTMFY